MTESMEDKIRERLKELEELKARTIEQLKIQQELTMKPIEAVIAELNALLPVEEIGIEKEKEGK
jgi:hypothetical protein